MCFVSRPSEAAPDAKVVGHSLVQSAASSYDLPPLATVTLEEVKPAGEWNAYGVAVQQPLLVVGVSYAVTHQKTRKLRWADPTGAQDAAAVKIQSVYRGKSVRQRMNVNHAAGADDFMTKFARDQGKARERERAAVKIQSAGRGYFARKHHKLHKQEQELLFA